MTVSSRPRSHHFVQSLRVALTVLTLAAGMFMAPAHAAAAPSASWVWPLDPQPEVVNGFDPPNERWNAGHRGVDLAGTVGQPVRAAGPGVVTYAGLLAGRGVITVSHGSLRTTYQPVDAIVTVGQVVLAGDTIGTLGVIGGHCLPTICLHWGLLRGSDYLNPLSLVGAGPIRLLPDSSRPSALREIFDGAAARPWPGGWSLLPSSG